MTSKRLFQTIRLWLTPSSAKRTKYLKDNHIFAEIGNNCSIMDRKVPLYANLIKIGNNVHIASKVDFITHDITHVMLNGLHKNGGVTIQEKIDCIEICDNVFIGSNTTILAGVRIGKNVVIGAGSLVNKDIPDNSVAAGVPVKVIGTFDRFFDKRMNEEKYPNGMKPHIGREIPDGLAEWLWNRFYTRRKENE